MLVVAKANDLFLTFLLHFVILRLVAVQFIIYIKFVIGSSVNRKDEMNCSTEYTIAVISMGLNSSLHFPVMYPEAWQRKYLFSCDRRFGEFAKYMIIYKMNVPPNSTK